MRKLATLYVDSYRELKNVRTITTAALFAAISMILGYFSIPIGPYLKIVFSTIADGFVYYLFGPVVGACFGGVVDVARYLVKPTGPFFPPLTLVSILSGILYGTLLYKRPLTLKRVFFAKFVVILICNIWLNTWCISILNGEAALAILPMRVFKNVIQWPVDSFLFFGIMRRMENMGVTRAIHDYRAHKTA